MGKSEYKVAVITGADSRICLPAARLFVNEGARVSLTGRRQRELDAALASIGKGAHGFRSDSASKAAIRNFARNWSLDLAPRKLRVNELAPAATSTPGLDGLRPTEEPRRTMRQGLVAGVPLGRMGAAEETARAALFLASNDNGFVNGIELFVDGGSAQS